MASTRPPADTACDNCGAPSDDLRPVHRVYLEADGSGTLTKSSAMPEVERWCAACRGTYPSEPV